MKQVIDAVKAELSAVTYNSDDVAKKIAPSNFRGYEITNKQLEIAKKKVALLRR